MSNQFPKIKTDRSKLLVEAKTLYNLIMGLNKSKEKESLKIVLLF